MKILALDLATKTGWAHTSGPSGVQNFALQRGDSPGMRWIRFQAWLGEVLDAATTDLIVYEQSHHRGGAATHVAETLIGLVEVVAAHRGIEVTSFHTSKVKQHATGNGKANKKAMLAAAEKRWPDVEIIDDNHADALWLLDLAVSKYGGRRPTP